MHELIQEGLIDLVLAVTAVVGGLIVNYLRRRATVAEIEAGMRIAKIVVSAVEQIAAAQGIDTQEKLARALAQARAIGAAKGISFSDEQWRYLIEQEVAYLKRIGGELTRTDVAQNGATP